MQVSPFDYPQFSPRPDVAKIAEMLNREKLNEIAAALHGIMLDVEKTQEGLRRIIHAQDRSMIQGIAMEEISRLNKVSEVISSTITSATRTQ